MKLLASIKIASPTLELNALYISYFMEKAYFEVTSGYQGHIPPGEVLTYKRENSGFKNVPESVESHQGEKSA